MQHMIRSVFFWCGERASVASIEWKYSCSAYSLWLNEKTLNDYPIFLFLVHSLLWSFWSYYYFKNPYDLKNVIFHSVKIETKKRNFLISAKRFSSEWIFFSSVFSFSLFILWIFYGFFSLVLVFAMLCCRLYWFR